MAKQEDVKIGKVVQIIGPVVDVEFEDYLPPIYQALRITSDGFEVETAVDVVAEVGVAALVVRIGVLERVHARDLYVGEERDQRDLVDGVAAAGLVPPHGGAKPDAEPQHAHAEGSRHEVVARLVDDHEQGETEDRGRDSDQSHRGYRTL